MSLIWSWSSKIHFLYVPINSQYLLHLFDGNSDLSNLADNDLTLSCDVLPYEVGAVLSHQRKDGTEQLIVFASRSLSPAEKQLDKEALALIFGVRKFHKYIYGQSFTDNKPLMHRTCWVNLKQYLQWRPPESRCGYSHWVAYHQILHSQGTNTCWCSKSPTATWNYLPHTRPNKPISTNGSIKFHSCQGCYD